MPIEAYNVNCEGGLVLDQSIFVMKPGEATTLQNFEPDVQGGYAKILGFEKFDTNALSGSGIVLGISTYKNQFVVAARGANVQFSSGSGWTNIATNRTSAGRYSFVTYDFDGTENLAMADGVNDAAIWDGSSYVTITASAGGTKPTAPDIVQEFKGHLFFGGMSNSPHTVKFSAPFNENDFSAASGAGEIAFGSDVVSLKPFREALIIFCKNEIYKLIGSSSADFQIQPITRNIGCLSHFTIQEIGGDLIFLAPDGLRTVAGTERIDDIELGTISKQVQPRLNALSSNQISNLSSHTIKSKSQYRMYFPTTSGTESNMTGLIGVLKRNAQSGQIGWEYSDIKGIKPSIAASGFISNVETILHGDYDDGFVYKQESGRDFDGTAISATYRTVDYTMGDVGRRKNMQRIIINYIGTGTVKDVDMNLEYDYGDILLPSPALYDLKDPAGAAFYGGGTYGSSEYNASVYTPLYRQSVEGSGFAVALKFTDSSSNPTYTLKGFGLEFTPGGRM